MIRISWLRFHVHSWKFYPAATLVYQKGRREYVAAAVVNLKICSCGAAKDFKIVSSRCSSSIEGLEVKDEGAKD